jgi:Tfp pilus assembly pilus retraction ATPase PilT
MPVDIQALLKATVDAKASDLHISTASQPMARMRGDMVPFQMPALEPQETRDALYGILTPAQKAEFEERHELDFAIEIPGLSRFRANFFEQRRGVGAVFRVIATKVPSLEELKGPAILRDLASKERGLVLVTGPTGSGKSTTLAAMIDYVNASFAKHIITIEDPIEFVHERKRCLINQREVGAHTVSFAAALRVRCARIRTSSSWASSGSGDHVARDHGGRDGASRLRHPPHEFRAQDDRPDRRHLPGRPAAPDPHHAERIARGRRRSDLIPTADGKGRVAAHEILIACPRSGT